MAVSTAFLWRDLGQVHALSSGPTGNSMFDPVVVGLKDGSFLVAYTDDSNTNDSSNGSDIIGQLYDITGHPLGTALQLNSLRRVDNEGNPELAALNDGGFVLVYEDTDAAGNSLIWQTHAANGTVTQSGVILNDPGADVLSLPRVAVFPDDSFVVSYVRRTGSDTDVKAKIVQADGAVGPEIDVRDHPDDPRQADVAVLDTDRFVIAYIEDDPAGARPEFRILDKSGSILVTENVPAPGSVNREPQIAVLAEDRFAIVWWDDTNTSNGDIYLRLFDDQGNDLAGLVEVSANAVNDEVSPAATPLADGGFEVVFESNGINRQILAQRFDADGNKVGGRSDVVSTNQLLDSPEVALLADGRFVATWAQFGGIGNGVDISANIWDPRDSLVFGTPDDDNIAGSNQFGSTIRGRDGDDSIHGGNLDDLIESGNGEDWADGRTGDDEIRGGGGGDRLFGNTGDDILRGGNGIDTLNGGSDADTILGQSGDDRITGGQGIDSLFGGSGADYIYGGQQFDIIRGGSGRDYAYGAGGADVFIVGPGEATVGDRFFGGSLFDNLLFYDGAGFVDGLLINSVERIAFYGTSGVDAIDGSTAADSMRGNSGRDSLSAGSGDDALLGQEGDDTIRGDSGDDRIFGGTGMDTLFGGEGIDSAYGDDGADRFAGGTGNDSLFGGLGRDFLNGGSGSDRLYGGNADDTFVVDRPSDRVFEGSGGGLRDLIRSSAQSFNLADDVQVEVIELVQGAGDIDFIGNDRDNSIFGNSGRNVLFGDQGNDTLDGGSGSDTLIGATGNDLMIVDTSGDLVSNQAVQGFDLVISSVDFSLPNGIEALELAAGSSAIDGLGNAGDNQLGGNSAANSLAGGIGNDRLIGERGSDRLVGEANDDWLDGGVGTDRLYGGGGDDTLFGGSGNDTLYGGGGDDTLELSNRDTASGRSGRDWFLLDGDETGNNGSGGPVVLDFSTPLLNPGIGRDRLVFGTGLENGSFDYRGGNSFSGGGNSEARHDGQGQIQVDSNGDGSSDLTFRLQGMSQAGQLTASDFIWL